ncbi:4a-hydroxytetrahydrobiopterin dehydratase [Amphritea sp. 1_MG-2023]|uniref:4a-hydroxytetrahydrobiopterin dehydratase n=1 Tax=Amphritea sp. 1_MG-2023 TaxID=3062670 RepID=UPI0026E1BE49|nr:4a-hydroxytetrahydrobiopterin dehydratase [Amphritea sp. 1_MG-2023]MDO6564815.1 4a-hydroxytetrahydrobiopterin dehydratase [Amphritea sp. 1_MG-2023]
MTEPDRLRSRHCLPYRGLAKLSRVDAEPLLTQLAPGWGLDAEAHMLQKSFKFDDFHQTMAFVNAVAWIAHRENHHPDLEVGYARCWVRYSTHAVDGLSENDFICAAMIDALEAE